MMATRLCRSLITATGLIISMAAQGAPQEMLSGREKEVFIRGFTEFCIQDQGTKYKQFERNFVERYCGCVAIGLSNRVPKHLLDNPTARPWQGPELGIGRICAAKIIHGW
jgi:hypothetical protein